MFFIGMYADIFVAADKYVQQINEIESKNKDLGGYSLSRLYRVTAHSKRYKVTKCLERNNDRTDQLAVDIRDRADTISYLLTMRDVWQLCKDEQHYKTREDGRKIQRRLDEINYQDLPRNYLEVCELILRPMLPYAFFRMKKQANSFQIDILPFFLLTVSADSEGTASSELILCSESRNYFPQIVVRLPRGNNFLLRDAFCNVSPKHLQTKLAYVLAHELAHCVELHYLRLDTLLPMQKSLEKEADLLSMDLMGADLYHGGWLRVLTCFHISRLLSQCWMEPKVPKNKDHFIVALINDWFRSHPCPLERIRYMLEHMIKKGSHEFHNSEAYAEEVIKWARFIVNDTIQSVKYDLVRFSSVYWCTINHVISLAGVKTSHTMDTFLQPIYVRSNSSSHDSARRMTQDAGELPLDKITDVSWWRGIIHKLR